MVYKQSKLDIGPVRRKQRPVKIKHEIKREVFDHDFLLKPKYKHPAKPQPTFTPVAKIEKVRVRQLVPFALATLVAVLFVQGLAYLSDANNASGQILGAATSAYENLDSAGRNLEDQNFDAAFVLFQSAQQNLNEALEKLDDYKALASITPQGRSASNLLKGAYLLSDAGASLTEGLKLFDQLKVSSVGIETDSFTQKLEANKRLFTSSLESLKQSLAYFEDTKSIPHEYRKNVDEAKQQIGQLKGILENLTALEELYLSLLGREAKTYLLVFQNYDEARATGGFIGTYGVLRVDGGKIEKLKIESVYELDGSLTTNIAAPGPFQPDIQKWGLRDANWFIDFPQSARKLLYFFEKGGESADGVIAVTPKIFEQLITLVGPIYMQQYDVVLTPSNFQEVVQEKTSVDYDIELNQPKKFLSDFAPIMLNRLTDLKKESWFSMFQIMQNNLSSRQIILYSKDPEVQSKITKLGFSGSVLTQEHDYLLIANTNLGGTKTDLDMVSKVNLTTKILSDGSVVNYLNIKRSNTSVESNRNYMRVLVPEGAELIAADGIVENQHNPSKASGLQQDPDLNLWDQGQLMWNKVFVRSEAGKKEFAAWVVTPGLGTTEINFTYTLPFKVRTGLFDNSATYSILLQKQPGSLPFEFNHELDPDGFVPTWLSPNVKTEDDNLIFKSNTAFDDYWAAILSHD